MIEEVSKEVRARPHRQIVMLGLRVIALEGLVDPGKVQQSLGRILIQGEVSLQAEKLELFVSLPR